MNTDFVAKKKEIADRMLSRGESGLYFLEEFLHDKQGGTDPVFSRSLYILLSYNFELILKSLLVLNSGALSIEGLEKELIGYLHNFQKISEKLTQNRLSYIGIKNIARTQQKAFIEYVVETNDGAKILVQDFKNVRYDFMSDDLRNIDCHEVSRIKQEIKSLLVIVKQIRVGYSVTKGTGYLL